MERATGLEATWSAARQPPKAIRFFSLAMRGARRQPPRGGASAAPSWPGLTMAFTTETRRKGNSPCPLCLREGHRCRASECDGDIHPLPNPPPSRGREWEGGDPPHGGAKKNGCEAEPSAGPASRAREEKMTMKLTGEKARRQARRVNDCRFCRSISSKRTNCCRRTSSGSLAIFFVYSSIFRWMTQRSLFQVVIGNSRPARFDAGDCRTRNAVK